MQEASGKAGFPEWLIVIGASVFTFVLILSAVFDPSIRWLHFFQAWMYVATIVLAIRRNAWGYSIGISAAGFWDYANLVATTFFRNGLHELSVWIQTGRLHHADQLIAVPAWFSNLFVVIGCVWAYSRRTDKRLADLGRFAAAFVLTTGFFAAAVALFQPRYLVILRRVIGING